MRPPGPSCRVPCLSWSSSPAQRRRRPGTRRSCHRWRRFGPDCGRFRSPSPTIRSLRAGLRPRARRGGCGPGRCRLEHRGGLVRPQRRAGRRRREHVRRPGGDGHPHPSRPLRAGRPGAGGLGGMDRAAPGRRRDARGPLRRHRRAGRQHVPLPGRLGRPRRQAPRPGRGVHGRQVDGHHGRPRRPVRGREAIDLPGWPLRTIWTPGHSPGHVCFYSEDRRLLISGDHVLPRITPNISAHTQQVANPLGDFLESLAKLEDLPADEVLPAHEYRFADLQGRLDELMAHHADRLDEIEEVLAEHPGSTAWEITLRLHWSRPWDEIQTSCSARPTGRPWPTASCSSCTTASGARGPSRPGSSWPPT